MKTGLVLRIPEADDLAVKVQAFAHPGAAADMPAHVTVLFPFREWETLDRSALGTLERLFAKIDPFTLRFSAVARFPGVAWLSPEPRSAVDRLTDRIFQAFPDCPPYGGQFDDPAPHLTLALSKPDRIDAILDHASSLLTAPIDAHVRGCNLFVLTEEGWRAKVEFPFGVVA